MGMNFSPARTTMINRECNEVKLTEVEVKKI